MISIIIGTNRIDSKSRTIGDAVKKRLEQQGEECQILDLRGLPGALLHSEMYTEAGQHNAVAQLQDVYISPVEKFIFIVPEYNGSFPGILKLFLDAVSVRNYKSNFSGKKAFLIGLASGRLGNAVGLEHLTSVLNYVGTSIFPRRLYLPGIDSKVTEGELTHPADMDKLNNMVDAFIKY